MNELIEFVKPELLVLVPACWGIGLAIKASNIQNKFIPLILCFFSMILACLWVFGSSTSENVFIMLFTAITQGLICWALSWTLYAKTMAEKE